MTPKKPEYKSTKEGFNHLRTSKQAKSQENGGVGSQDEERLFKQIHKPTCKKATGLKTAESNKTHKRKEHMKKSRSKGHGP